MAEPSFIWWNGRLVPWNEAVTHVSQLMWSGCGSVFEGLRAYHASEKHRIFLFGLEPHLRRLRRSMHVMGMTTRAPSIDTLREATMSVVGRNALATDQYVRIFLWFDDGANYAADQPVHAFVSTAPLRSRLGEPRAWRGIVSSWQRIQETSMPVRVKSVANYMNSRMAGSEAFARGADIGIMLNARGEVTEGPKESLFLVSGGQLVTPPLNAGVLDSITRRAVMTIAAEVSIPVVERTVQRGELYEADELFTCATSSEITPIVAIDNFTVGNGQPGPITSNIREIYRQAVYGETPLLGDLRTAFEV